MPAPGQQFSGADALQMFKNVYGQANDLVPDDQPLGNLIPFSKKERIGSKYQEAAVLTRETGITLSATNNAFTIKPARAGSIRESEVNAFLSVLPSLVPWGIISRSTSNDGAFYEATKFIVKNNLSSHNAFHEVFRLYGQSVAKLGYVSYATTTYRGANFVAGTGTLVKEDGTTIAFTNGVNVAEKAILLAPGQFAAGIWIGFEGVGILEINSSNVVVGQGSLVSVNSSLGYITVDFVPTVPTATTGSGSMRLCWEGMENNQEYPGIAAIMQESGTLFGISTSQFSLWAGNVGQMSTVGGGLFTLPKYNTLLANLLNRSRLKGALQAFINPRSWATLTTNEAALRQYDSSYGNKALNGFDSIAFKSGNGTTNFTAHNMVKEGDCFVVHVEDWIRSGSADVGFRVPGFDQEIVFNLQDQAAIAFRSFSDQFIYPHRPYTSMYITGINDEASA